MDIGANYGDTRSVNLAGDLSYVKDSRCPPTHENE